MKVQERVITTKTADGKTVLTKITTLPGEEIEEIEEETIETIDGETKTNKSKSQVVKAPVGQVYTLPNGKVIQMKVGMKTDETHTDYDEETRTTIVTKRLANGYEQTFSTITPEGNNKSWTKTFFDPVAVEGDEEEEEIEEYEEIETSGGEKKTTTTTQQEAPKAVTKPAAAPAAAKTVTKPSTAPKTVTTTTKTPSTAKAPVKPSEVTVVKKVPNGETKITTTVDAQGRETTKIHTMQDLPDQAEEYEEYEETHITEESPKTKKTTTTTQAAAPKKTTTTQVVPAKNTSTTTTVAVPGARNPKDNVLARKVVSKGEESIQITEEHTETEFSPSRKSTVSTTIIPSTGEKLDPKGKTTVTKVVIPGSQSTVVTKSNEQDGKQIVAKKGPSGTQNIAKTTNADGSQKVQVTTTVNPEELHIEETETTNIIGDKTITTTRTEVPIPGKKIVTQHPPTKVAGKGPKTTTTTTTTTLPVGEDRKTTVTKRVADGIQKGTEVSVKTETKDGKTRLETRTKFDPIFHPAVSDGEEEIEEFEETQVFAPVKTKTTVTSRVPVDASKKKPDAASSKNVSTGAASKK